MRPCADYAGQRLRRRRAIRIPQGDPVRRRVHSDVRDGVFVRVSQWAAGVVNVRLGPDFVDRGIRGRRVVSVVVRHDVARSAA